MRVRRSQRRSREVTGAPERTYVIADSARLNGDQRERTAARGLSGYECLENGGRLSVMTVSEGARAGAGDDLAGVGDRVRAAGGDSISQACDAERILAVEGSWPS